MVERSAGEVGWAEGLKESTANAVAKDYVPVSGYQCPPIAADFLTFLLASRGERAHEFLAVQPPVRTCRVHL